MYVVPFCTDGRKVRTRLGTIKINCEININIIVFVSFLLVLTPPFLQCDIAREDLKTKHNI